MCCDFANWPNGMAACSIFKGNRVQPSYWAGPDDDFQCMTFDSGVYVWMSDIDLIIGAEVYKSCTYKDSIGKLTVCYGFNLERGAVGNEVAAVGGDYNSLINGGCIT